MRRALTIFTAALVAAFVVSGPAAAASDDPTPYAVTPAGLDLPRPLAAHDHVNVRLTDGRTAGLHLDPNVGHPGAPWIGASHLPWSALGVTDGCVAWVQVAGYDEHHGEGGQSPVCLGTPTPTSTEEPSWTPDPTDSPTSSPTPTDEPSTSSPEETETPTTAPSPDTTTPALPDPEPTTPATSEPEPQPSASSTSPTTTPPTTSEPTLDCPDGTVPGWLGEDGQPTSCVDDRPTSWPGDEPEPPGDVDHPECELGLDGECDAGDPCSVTPSACPTVDPTDPATTPPVVPDTLPQTGAHTLAATTLAVALAVAGVALLTARRRHG